MHSFPPGISNFFVGWHPVWSLENCIFNQRSSTSAVWPLTTSFGHHPTAVLSAVDSTKLPFLSNQNLSPANSALLAGSEVCVGLSVPHKWFNAKILWETMLVFSYAVGDRREERRCILRCSKVERDASHAVTINAPWPITCQGVGCCWRNRGGSGWSDFRHRGRAAFN